MKNQKGSAYYLTWLVVMVLQVIASQIFGLLISLLFSWIFGFDPYPDTHPGIFVLLVGIMYSSGIFLTGWLAVRLGKLKVKPRYAARLAGTLIGAYLPLLLAWVLYKPMQPGNPLFFVAILTAVIGFQVPGWFQQD